MIVPLKIKWTTPCESQTTNTLTSKSNIIIIKHDCTFKNKMNKTLWVSDNKYFTSSGYKKALAHFEFFQVDRVCKNSTWCGWYCS